MTHEICLDSEACIACAGCVAACPQAIFTADGGVVSIDAGRVPYCIGCGHCVAVCPQEAVALDDAGASGQTVVPAPLSEVQRDMLFKARRSIRKYKPLDVPITVVASALELARYAPTASNTEQVEWLLLSGRQRLQTLAAQVADWARGLGGRYINVAAAYDAGRDVILRGAPALILAHVEAGSRWAAQDCTAAVSYLELALHSLGLGSCWSGFVLSAARAGIDLGLPLPEGRAFQAGLMIGYPDIRFLRLPARKPVRLTVVSG